MLLGLACFWQDNISCPLTSKALSCVQAIHVAQDLGFKNVELEGDSEVLISKLNVADIDKSTISSIIFSSGGGMSIRWRRDEHQFRRCWIVIERGGSDFVVMITDLTILARSGSFLAIIVSASTLL